MLFRACAKVNLTLEVGAGRQDGYHELRSIVCAVSLYDELDISLKPGGGTEFYCSDASIPRESNTAYRAAELFLARYAPGSGAVIRLTKHIPSQAGLGGGSSDASCVLLALNALTRAGAGQKELAEAAASLGSDMPLFIYGGACLMEGRGERITPLPDAFPLELVILKPGSGISTGEAYALIDRIKGGAPLSGPRSLPGTREEYFQTAFNDFGEPAGILSRETVEAEERLKQSGAAFTLLCGSGSAVMGAYPDRKARDRALASLRHAADMAAYPCRTLTRQEYFNILYGETP
ncbi:MAG: 4-(cytidine 5'-diphospho)-2-C-methyl-D-erythritol kinase [Abditibacteriota bacterium]|nr:4-(cytidine 5'-diphospho)-2-C-methyl-D-erythritol kinase [Abditibacteriota bacterium]